MPDTDVNLQRKRRQKNLIVGQMIEIYCHGVHKQQKGLCPACEALKHYAEERTGHCPRISESLFCSGCTVHCYAEKEREAIRQVMRYAGPRMMLYHPISAFRHLRALLKDKTHKGKAARA